MRQSIGMFLQFCCLVFLPLLIFYQLEFGFKLIVMPISLLIAVVVFTVGYYLRRP